MLINADSLKRTILRIKHNFQGVHLPPRFSLGKGTQFILLADCELRIGNDLNLGDDNLIKSHDTLTRDFSESLRQESFPKGKSTIVFGEKLTTRRGCLFQLFGGKLLIGNNVFFNNYCCITSQGRIEIGDNTFFGEGVKIYDHNHKYEFREAKLQVAPLEFSVGKITIGQNCWIASNVIILNNVTIGDNVLIGGGCLIHKSIPSNTIVMHKEELVLKGSNE
jgi:acetyltransferase-like isoleucine patch superfamily enzyme